MPKRTDIKSILILGAGPIVIGQACEFDYSGAQACKALREEGYRVILVNSNPATIMTDPEMADATYIEPIDWQVVRNIIIKEQPDAILPTMGGQTALNCALDLNKHGVLSEFNVELIGASADAIDKAEDRERFDKAMKSIGLACPRAEIAHDMEQAHDVLTRIGFPCIIRPSFTMGGSGGGIAYNKDEFNEICARGLDLSPTSELLIDESLIGWKEYEMEVVRDRADNCIIVCTIENFDPMGVHTGDSITVAPAQTLTDKEFQIMRNAAMAVLREIGVETGGSNVQFGVDPETGRMVIIEMNPRVSRSSALASKATGFPIAKIAAKLAVGYTLDELDNDITGGKTPASFEPAIDYVVTKIPRFNFEKFAGANDRLTTQMKSVGEVMAIGRNQQESLQKALRGLEVGVTGLDSVLDLNDPEAKNKIVYELREPSAERIWYIGDAFRMGMSVDEVFALTNIDRWYLVQLEEIVQLEAHISNIGIAKVDQELMRTLKRKGFADARIATLTKVAESDVRDKRHKFNIFPVYKRVDTCAAEFSTSTAYMYSTYDEECEAKPSDKAKIMVIGGGPNRIGQGIEFDYCCVHAALALRDDGYETIMVNCNPETVSTDYDTSDRLYFEPVTLEDVLEIVRVEQPEGVIVQYGGQTPLKLARALKENRVKIIGTSPDAIDRAEDRERFQQMVIKLGLKQPANATVSNMQEALENAEKIGFPLVVRPSYVLGGRAMEIVYDMKDLKRYLNEAVKVSNDSPVLLDRFLDDAIGVHSGDSACSLPPYSLSPEIQDEMRKQVTEMALELEVIGLMNTQFAIKDDEVYLIEVNPRAARTVPFVSKATGIPLAKIAARVMSGKSLQSQGVVKETIPPFYSVKEVVLPFAKFQGVDPLLGPEMRSTGEVMGVGVNFEEAYAKAALGASCPLPHSGKVLLSVRNNDKKRLLELAKLMLEKGFELEATSGTAKVINDAGMSCSLANKLAEGRPNIVDFIKNGVYSYIVNTTEGRQAITDSVYIRREALLNKVPYTTTLNAAFAAMQSSTADAVENVNSVQALHQQIEA